MRQRAFDATFNCPEKVHDMSSIIVGDRAARLPAPTAWAVGEGSFFRGVVDNWDGVNPLRVESLKNPEQYIEFLMTGELHTLQDQPSLPSFFGHYADEEAKLQEVVQAAMERAQVIVEQLVLADFVIDEEFMDAILNVVPFFPHEKSQAFFVFLLDLEMHRQNALHVKDCLPDRKDAVEKLAFDKLEEIGKVFVKTREIFDRQYGRELASERMLELFCERCGAFS